MNPPTDHPSTKIIWSNNHQHPRFGFKHARIHSVSKGILPDETKWSKQWMEERDHLASSHLYVIMARWDWTQVGRRKAGLIAETKSTTYELQDDCKLVRLIWYWTTKASTQWSISRFIRKHARRCTKYGSSSHDTTIHANSMQYNWDMRNIAGLTLYWSFICSCKSSLFFLDGSKLDYKRDDRFGHVSYTKRTTEIRLQNFPSTKIGGFLLKKKKKRTYLILQGKKTACVFILSHFRLVSFIICLWCEPVSVA